MAPCTLGVYPPADRWASTRWVTPPLSTPSA